MNIIWIIMVEPGQSGNGESESGEPEVSDSASSEVDHGFLIVDPAESSTDGSPAVTPTELPTGQNEWSKWVKAKLPLKPTINTDKYTDRNTDRNTDKNTDKNRF